MKRIFLSVAILLGYFNVIAQFEELTFGTDSTLDVVSWNIEHFPKNGQITIDLVSQNLFKLLMLMC